ncbi:biogenesis of lysosome-related organelles complex 1 subunit 6-like [Leptopilina heterotoma]|uniref:biogenesis of lysosome-related organelles complex 1 subunit 6-like n=1 Tax=Leptopilina heterotoma TaxID=63436 RepID=UPI001CA91BAB|nr:biogenesis of lysosome-related organelles complex 1 subunit 6-like [Leptopilina heterotoma]
MMSDVDESVVVDEIQPELRSSKRENEELSMSQDLQKAAEELTQGLLNIYQPPLEQLEKELKELTTKQETLLHEMQNENKKINDVEGEPSINEIFSMINTYQTKLASLKSDMVSIHERTSKLKNRALRLQKTKQKEAVLKEQKREQELRREQELIGKPKIEEPGSS